MRSNSVRRWSTPHAERGLVRKRQTTLTTLEIHPEPTSAAAGFSLTAPTTITFVETITDTASSSTATAASSSSSLSRSESSAIITSTSSSAAQSTSTSLATAYQMPSETATSTISTSAPTISPTDTTTPLASGALSSTQVPGGAIAAIVIACLIVIVVGLFYLTRLKSRRNRMKRRPKWSPPTSGPLGNPSSSYGSSLSQPRIQFPAAASSPPPPSRQLVDPPPIVQIPGANVTLPPRLYNGITENNNNNNLNPALTSSRLDLISTPKAIYTLGLNGKRSAFAATVTSTFITTLPDELSIDVGEMLRVVAEYDDGWSLCMNVRGEQGMVPTECLDRGRQPELRQGVSMSSLASTAATQDWRASRRVSSLRRP